MAGRSQNPNASKNAKRRERRGRLSDRLHLAEQDANRMQQRYEPAARAATSSPRGKPSRAAHLQEPLVEAKEELVSSGDDRDQRGVLDAADHMQDKGESSDDAGASGSRGRAKREVDDLDEAPGGASGWIERGRAVKQQQEGERRLRLRSAERPPWRAPKEEHADEGLRGVKRVLPRWRVEQELEREQRETERTLSDEECILSKIATQLLRWGRSDVVTHHGRRTVYLERYRPGKWYSVEELALAMGVLESDLPLRVLLSEGSHGPRVLHQQQGGRIWIQARWTGDRGGRGHRDGARHEHRAGFFEPGGEGEARSGRRGHGGR